MRQSVLVDVRLLPEFLQVPCVMMQKQRTMVPLHLFNACIFRQTGLVLDEFEVNRGRDRPGGTIFRKHTHRKPFSLRAGSEGETLYLFLFFNLRTVVIRML